MGVETAILVRQGAKKSMLSGRLPRTWGLWYRGAPFSMQPLECLAGRVLQAEFLDL